jgi:hypothetical protein
VPSLKSVIGPNNTAFVVPDIEGAPEDEAPTYVLVLDHDETEGEDVRLHIPIDDEPSMPDVQLRDLVKPEDIPSIKLDLLCVDNDKNYFKTLEAALNLPNYIKTGLPSLYHGL